MGDVTSNSLQCYEQLTKWPELEQAVMVNVDDNDPPSLDKIWEDSYRQVSTILTPRLLPQGYFHLSSLELFILCPWDILSSCLGLFCLLALGLYLSLLQEQYLPFVLHAKLKMACSGDLDPSLVSFIEMALLDEDRKSLLEVWLHCYRSGWGLIISCRTTTLMSWRCSISYEMTMIVQTTTLTVVTSCLLGYSPVCCYAWCYYL